MLVVLVREMAAPQIHGHGTVHEVRQFGHGCTGVVIEGEGDGGRVRALSVWAVLGIFGAALLFFLLAPMFLGLGLAADQPGPVQDSVARSADRVAAREVRNLLSVRDASDISL